MQDQQRQMKIKRNALDLGFWGPGYAEICKDAPIFFFDLHLDGKRWIPLFSNMATLMHPGGNGKGRGKNDERMTKDFK